MFQEPQNSNSAPQSNNPAVTDSSVKYSMIMLIDDNELDNFVNRQLVENENFAKQVVVYQSALSALEYLKKNAGNENEIPAIIFLDIMMPGMDGFAFLDEYAKLSDTIRNKVKIVMLSTTESFKDLNRANQNKFVHKFLNKPLTQASLSAIG